MAQPKPNAILQLEKEIGKPILQVEESEIRQSEIAFCMDEKGTITGLALNDCKISNILMLSNLTDLTVLRLNQNRITDLSLFPKFPHLVYLSLQNNWISDVSPLAVLTGLKNLYFYVNHISDLSPLSTLTGLMELGLSYNLIYDLSPLATLTRLAELYLKNNHISDLSPLAPLTRLINLRLSGNQISYLSPLTTLTALTNLELDNNQIADLTPLTSLTGLNVLILNHNQITDLSPLTPLTGLRGLYLSANQIADLSPLAPLVEKNLEYIAADNNPIETPPIEIVDKGSDAIISYFKQLKEKVRLLQCKLLIVGSGEVGKTTLMKKLKAPSIKVKEGKEPTTHGINIIPWELPCTFSECLSSVSEHSTFTPSEMSDCTVKLFFWDFGGQDIYHSTHQFFLTKRSLYILVWEARKEEESRSFDFWLNVVKLLGSGSPVIVVMNKSDIRTKSIDEATLKKKFPQIVEFLKISCVSNTGLTELKELIQKTLGKMPHLQDLLPASWVHIRDDLKKQGADHIPASSFYDICNSHNIKKEDAGIIGDYLHDLGAILFFRNDSLLSDTVILKPEWATQAVYALLDAKPIIENKGSFEYNDLKIYWDSNIYPVSLHPQLIRLMEKFELCFNFVHTDKYFIPELLPGDPVEFDTSPYRATGSLHFQYKYTFMPEGILSRFIARLYYMSHAKRFWKYGVELYFDQAFALVVSEPSNSLIQVHITGTNKNGLLTIIRSHFNHIHQTLNMNAGEHFNEMIPCNCSGCTDPAKIPEPYYYPYSHLRKFLGNNVKTVPCINSCEQVDIEGLLNGFEPSKPSQEMLQAIIQSSRQLMGISGMMKPDEDTRNTLLCLLLNEKGFFVKDQTRWGKSEGGKRLGELDALIKTPNGEEAVLEAFNLDNLERKKINTHCLKIFKYDPVGLKTNFIVVYCDCGKTFPELWTKYKNHVEHISFDFPIQSGLVEKQSGYAEIKIARAIHNRQGEDVGIYHVFLHMG